MSSNTLINTNNTNNNNTNNNHLEFIKKKYLEYIKVHNKEISAVVLGDNNLFKSATCGFNKCPSSYELVKQQINISTTQDELMIAGVLLDFKKIALVDIDIDITDQPTIDMNLRYSKQSVNCNLLYTHIPTYSSTTLYFYKKYMQPNIDLLIAYANKDCNKVFKDELVEMFAISDEPAYFDIFQGLLLGYTDTSLFLYQIHNLIEKSDSKNKQKEYEKLIEDNNIKVYYFNIIEKMKKALIANKAII